MKSTLRISLKSGERIFVNGAVLRVDRKVAVEFLNDVTFLLENHVLQPEDASSPLRQLYFIAQTMLMDPANADTTRTLFDGTHRLMMSVVENEDMLEGLKSTGDFIAAGKIFDALKTIRGLYGIEQQVLAGNTEHSNRGNERREVA